MSLLLKVVAEANEITPRDLRGTIEKRTSGAKALINRLFLYDTPDALRSKHFPAPSAHPPAPGAKTLKIFLLSASGNVHNLDLRHVTILYTATTPAPNGNTRVCRPEKLPHASADPAPTPPRTTHRLPRAPGRRLSALSAHIFPKPFSTRRRPYPRPTPAAQGNQLPAGRPEAPVRSPPAVAADT
jgi:hypothetical protein